MVNFNFPKLPTSKIDFDENGASREQRAAIKILNKEEITEQEAEDIHQAIEFYKVCFPYLQSIPLGALTVTDIDVLKKYLHETINFHWIIANDITFEILFRVTKVKDEFLENGKVRNPKYLIFPSLEIIKSLGQYNRASSPDSTVFYASFFESVALHEVKPQINERILITTWCNVTNKKFVSFPIANNESVKNKMLEHSTAAVKMLGQRSNPLLFNILDLYFKFLSAEFVKSENIISPKRTEYFYSAYFGDMILKRDQVISDKIKPKYVRENEIFDCILYPSVAFNHQEENLAVAPDSMLKNLHPVRIEDCIVEATNYGASTNREISPIKKRILRTVTGITADNKLIWSDDTVSSGGAKNIVASQASS